MLSGGMDSEVVVKAFLEAKVPFKTSTFRIMDSDVIMNPHEIKNVERFCAANNLMPSYFDISLDFFAQKKRKHLP